MTPQYKLEITYETGGNAEVTWNDDDTMEVDSLPDLVTVDSAVARMKAFELIVDYCRRYKAIKFDCSKLP